MLANVLSWQWASWAERRLYAATSASGSTVMFETFVPPRVFPWAETSSNILALAANERGSFERERA